MFQKQQQRPHSIENNKIQNFPKENKVVSINDMLATTCYCMIVLCHIILVSENLCLYQYFFTFYFILEREIKKNWV